jgi:GNAT superfamily N-acetyltransferase
MSTYDGHSDCLISAEPCSDIPVLSTMFLELAEDEKSEIQRTVKAANEEMACLLEREKAYKFSVSDEIIGYALVNTNRKPCYLHHFYICRSHRRKGYGTSAFYALLKALNIKEIDLDVYDWNERGKSFWNALGFKPRAIIMRYRK